MASSWQEEFFEKLVEASHDAGDPRLAAAKLHRRKRTASFEHRQLRKVECSFDTNRTSGNEESQVLLIGCEPRRGTDIDWPVLKREFDEAGLGGGLQMESEHIFFQYRWGFGRDAAFPVHDPRRVEELTTWATSSLRLLFDHLERRHQVAVPARSIEAVPRPPLDLRVTLEEYLEDLLVAGWENLPWAGELEFLQRQVDCGALGRIDILARDRTSRDFVVIELKRDQGDDEIVGQLSRYMGWVMEHRASPAKVGVRGIIVAHEISERLEAAARPHENISLYTYHFSVTLMPVASGQDTTEDETRC